MTERCSYNDGEHRASIKRGRDRQGMEDFTMSVQAIDNLRAVRDCCLAGDRMDGDLARWLAERLQQVFSGVSTSFDEAFEIRFPRGGVPWWKEERIRERDAALRALATALPGTAAERLRAVHRLTLRHAACAWPREQAVAAMPPHYAGTPRAHLWRAFHSGAPMPLSDRRLRTILGGI